MSDDRPHAPPHHDDNPGADALMHVFDQVLPPDAIAGVRGILDAGLGRRPDLQAHERDLKWWLNLGDLVNSGSAEVSGRVLRWFCATPLVGWARDRLGPELVFVLEYCIMRRFDPRRRPIPAQWHFDANIFGLTSPMVNFWMPLVDVGETAPGLTLANAARSPQVLWSKLNDIAAERGGAFDSTNRRLTLFTDAEVADALAAAPDVKLVTPLVRAGGAIAFDHQYLHGTQSLTPAMQVRDSLEIRVLPLEVALALKLPGRYKVVKVPKAV